jgi:hypothetical protein
MFTKGRDLLPLLTAPQLATHGTFLTNLRAKIVAEVL